MKRSAFLSLAVAASAAAVGTTALAACGQAGPGGGGGSAAKPTVRVGSANFPEAIILGEMYGQVLEASGFRVERKLNLGNREIYATALDSGQIDLVPEYLATYTTFVTKDQKKASTDPAATLKNLQEALKAKGLTALDYAPAVDTNGFVVTKATADRYKLVNLSDLAAQNGALLLGGPPECPARDFCLIGLQGTYGLRFKEFKPLDAGGPLTVAALKGSQVDVALLFTTDAAIQTEGLVLLRDDKRLQLADNILPVVRDDLLGKAPEIKTLLNGLAPKITTEELTGLNRKVGIDKQEPRAVAGAWLKSMGLTK